ncbi:hypothetical protein NM688_g555 [Phlebia brevispora]|uniref:Uncharacterized protein n=1 Tax=Phlebia brevispora TaxID=194682 RepID=A0ACC1TE02_9APHY|nr:hypothetical protein NM688_g555 [Phlebia brevispora]
MALGLISLASILVTLAYATSHVSRANQVVIESLPSVPSGYKDIGLPNPNDVITLHVVMKESNLNSLMATLEEVSTPGSEFYGQYVGSIQASRFLTPTQQAINGVIAWLTNAKEAVIAQKLSSTWLQINIPVSKANDLLETNFHVYEDTNTGERIVRTLSYSIPENLAKYIDFVYPTIHFEPSFPEDPVLDPDPTKERNDLTADRCDSEAVTPHCVQQLYGISNMLITQGSRLLGVIGQNGQYANKEDLQSFLTRFRPDLDPNLPEVRDLADFKVQTIDGGKNLQDRDQTGIEAGLNMQYTVGVASGVPTSFVTVGPDTADIPTELRWIYGLLMREDSVLPKVISFSYGRDERYLTERLARKICTGFAALAVRGVSVIAASGDGGVGGSSGSNDANQKCFAFVPTTAACPFITSVGGTALDKTPSGGTPAVEHGAGFSSGGFSKYFTAPAYQQKAVQDYLSSAPIPKEYDDRYNRQGRGFPDVSAAGDNIAFMFKGSADIGSGTSASAPIFASMIALINNAREDAGKPPLGFLNPFLYQNSRSLFNDIMTGNNPGCGTDGFSAVAGWDPVTGLGTPKFQALKEAALQL